MKWKKSKSSGRGVSWLNYDSIEDNTLRLQITKADDVYEVHLFRRMARTITDYLLLKQLPQGEIKKITDKILKSTDIKSTAGQLNSQYKKYADMKHVKPYMKESIMKLTKSKLKGIIREEATKIISEKTVRRGSKITYMKHFHFGKKGKETAKVVAIKGDHALLDNGDKLRLTMIKLKPKDYKIESVEEAREINVDDLLKNSKVKQIMKRLGIRGNDTKSVAKVIQHFMRNPSDLKMIGI